MALNTVILAIGRLSYQVVMFLLLPIYTRFLTPSQYGMVDLIVVYVSLLVPTLTVQMEMAAFRFLIDVRDSEKGRSQVITNAVIIAFRFFLPALVIVASIGLIMNFEYTPTTLLLTFTTLCFNLSSQIARGLGNNKQYTVASVLLSFLLVTGTGIFIVLLKLGVYGLIASMALANMIAALFLAWKIKLFKYIKRKKIDKSLQKEMLNYSLPLVPNSLAWWVINVSDRTIISVMLSVAANGIYAAASKFSSVMASVYSIFYMAWTESASLCINSKDRNEFFSRVANLSVNIFGHFGLLLIAVMPFVFSIMTGGEFVEAYNYVPILVLGVFFNVVVGIYSSIYVAKKLTKQVMNTSIVAGVLNIIVSAGLMPWLEVCAAAIGTVVSFLVMAIYRHYDSKKFVSIRYDKGLFIWLALLLAAVLLAYYLGGLVIQMIVLVLVFVAAMFANSKDLIRVKEIMIRKLR